jgi:DNA mismatch repair protein MutS
MTDVPVATRFASILFPGPDSPTGSEPDPDTLHDLNLDQWIATLAERRKEYPVARFFLAPLAAPDAIGYRQAIMRDLEQDAGRNPVSAFADELREVRRHLSHAGEASYPLEQQRWFLRAAERYVDAVERFAVDTAGLDLESDGLRSLREYVTDHANSVSFGALSAEARQIAADLAAIRYTLLIREGRVTVRDLGLETEYSPLVEATFEKFRQPDGRDYRSRLPARVGMNHIQAQILDRVARLHPDVFGQLELFWTRRPSFPDPLLSRFEQEIQFYLGFLDAIRPLREAGLPFCYPQVSGSRAISARDSFDLVLATKLVAEGQPVVCNDFALRGRERILVVSGPNQSGKTTFARAFGQVHYLATLGCPVPGREATLFLFDRLLTQFEREESLENQRGKLKDDLVRIRGILDRATPNSIVIVNELFSSATLEDQRFLSMRVMEILRERDLLGVCVTFLRELAALGEHTVSMVSVVDPADPALRTFRLERQPATGVAYALLLAEKHGVTAECLLERIRP